MSTAAVPPWLPAQHCDCLPLQGKRGAAWLDRHQWRPRQHHPRRPRVAPRRQGAAGQPALLCCTAARPSVAGLLLTAHVQGAGVQACCAPAVPLTPRRCPLPAWSLLPPAQAGWGGLRMWLSWCCSWLTAAAQDSSRVGGTESCLCCLGLACNGGALRGLAMLCAARPHRPANAPCACTKPPCCIFYLTNHRPGVCGGWRRLQKDGLSRGGPCAGSSAPAASRGSRGSSSASSGRCRQQRRGGSRGRRRGRGDAGKHRRGGAASDSLAGNHVRGRSPPLVLARIKRAQMK